MSKGAIVGASKGIGSSTVTMCIVASGVASGSVGGVGAQSSKAMHCA